MVLGVRILLAAGTAAPVVATSGSSFRIGLLTSLSNPKAAPLMASLFAALLPPHAPASVGLATVAEMVTISVCWYATVACTIASRPVAAAYARSRRWLDRIAGAIFIGFGARLALERA